MQSGKQPPHQSKIGFEVPIFDSLSQGRSSWALPRRRDKPQFSTILTVSSLDFSVEGCVRITFLGRPGIVVASQQSGGLLQLQDIAIVKAPHFRVELLCVRVTYLPGQSPAKYCRRT